MSDFDIMAEEPVARGRKPKLATGKGTVDNSGRVAEAHGREMPTRQLKAGGEVYYIDFPEHTKHEFNPESSSDEGYYYRAVADRDGNIAKRKAMGFEFALADDTGEQCVRTGSDGVRMVLMRQPGYFRREDLDLKRKAASAMVVSEQHLGEGQYLPDGRKNVLQRDSDLDPFQK